AETIASYMVGFSTIPTKAFLHSTGFLSRGQTMDGGACIHGTWMGVEGGRQGRISAVSYRCVGSSKTRGKGARGRGLGVSMVCLEAAEIIVDLLSFGDESLQVQGVGTESKESAVKFVRDDMLESKLDGTVLPV